MSYFFKIAQKGLKAQLKDLETAGCIERFQKQRLQNFFDHVYFYVDTDEKETLLAL